MKKLQLIAIVFFGIGMIPGFSWGVKKHRETLKKITATADKKRDETFAIIQKKKQEEQEFAEKILLEVSVATNKEIYSTSSVILALTHQQQQLNTMHNKELGDCNKSLQQKNALISQYNELRMEELKETHATIEKLTKFHEDELVRINKQHATALAEQINTHKIALQQLTTDHNTQIQKLEKNNLQEREQLATPNTKALQAVNKLWYSKALNCVLAVSLVVCATAWWYFSNTPQLQTT